nr:Chain B, Ras and Rab interactor 3 [Homo sapiens]4WCI_D Chain D, Ras and Rab interactor 3 [Homo sapiens]4WCI_F Chain F, Ras and Rab interactor 3 [Homo sapiens]
AKKNLPTAPPRRRVSE